MCAVYKSLLQLLEQKIISECKDKITSGGTRMSSPPT